MAAPIRPVRPGDPISAAKFNQVVEVLNSLGQVSGSFPIEVEHDQAGVRVGLAREFKHWLFSIQEVSQPLQRTPDNIPYYYATRLRLDGDDSYDAQWPQDVRLYDPLARFPQDKELAEGTWVLASFDADVGRWQIVRDPYLGPRVVRFKLTGTLTLGGSAPAVIRKWDSTASGGSGAYVDGDTITVNDYFGAQGDPGEWQAPSGYYGFAVKLVDLDEYQILYLEHQAEFLAFTLTSDMSGGSAGATFNSFWMGRSTASATTVYDRQSLYASAKSGDKGIACWDSKLGQYVIIDMGKGGTDLALFYLNADLAQGGSAAATLRVWNAGLSTWQTTGAGVTVWDSSNLGPATTSTLGVAFLSPQSGRYEIIALPGSGGAQVVRFRLYAPLALGGSAAAKLQTWDSGSSSYVDGADITVVDFYGSLGRRGKWQGPSGYYGFAVKLADKDEYQILDMERIALFAQVTLDEDMGDTTPHTAAATFDAFWQGQSTAGAANVLDPLHIYPGAKIGDKFIVCWDDVNGYKIIDGPSANTIRWARAYTGHTLDTDSQSEDHYVECQAVDDRTGAGYDSGSAHFNVYLPSPSSATDPNVQAGAIIGYTIDPSGDAVCVTGYLDDARGMIKIWSGAAADIPAGWHLCDGSTVGGLTTPDLRGKFVLGAQPAGSEPFDDEGDSNDIGETGGHKKHKHDDHKNYRTEGTVLNASTALAYPAFFQLNIQPLYINGQTKEGRTDSEHLSADVVWPTASTVIDGLSATVEVPTTPLNVVTSIGIDVCIAHRGGDDPGACGNLEAPVVFDPDPPTATTTLDTGAASVTIEPEFHSHRIPPLDIELGPVAINYSAAFVDGGYYTTISPNPHDHKIPDLPHSLAYNVPPYYALCYIMRVN